MTSLIISGVILALLAAVALLSRRLGRAAAQLAIAEKNLRIKDEQLKAVLARPDRGVLLDGLRNGKF